MARKKSRGKEKGRKKKGRREKRKEGEKRKRRGWKGMPAKTENGERVAAKMQGVGGKEPGQELGFEG